MKRNAILGEIGGLSDAELKTKARAIAEELMKLRFRKVVAQLNQTHLIRAKRRDLARALSAISKRRLDSQKAGASS